MAQKRMLIIKDYSGAVIQTLTATVSDPKDLFTLLFGWLGNPKLQTLIINNPVVCFVEVPQTEEKDGSNAEKTESVFDRPEVQAALAEHFNLSPEDLNTAVAYLKGQTRNDIVEQEGAEVECVKKRVNRLFKKVGAKSQMALQKIMIAALKKIRAVKHLFEYY